MKCTKCEVNESVTNGAIAFTKPLLGFEGKVPEDISGEFCDTCYKKTQEAYAIIYRPEHISRAEARKP